MRVEHLNYSHLRTVNSTVNAGTFTLMPPRLVRKYKPNGGYRTIGVPTMRDQIYLSTANEIVSAVVDSILPDCVHGFRPQHSIDTAWKYVLPTLLQSTYVALLDINKAYDNVNIELLRYIAHTRIFDQTVLDIIDTVTHYKAPVTQDYLTQSGLETGVFTRLGLVQGYSTSPSLFNLYLIDVNERMQSLAQSTYGYAIYADNAILCDTSYDGLQETIGHFTRMLRGLGMSCTYSIVDLRNNNQFKWLGRNFSNALI